MANTSVTSRHINVGVQPAPGRHRSVTQIYGRLLHSGPGGVLRSPQDSGPPPASKAVRLKLKRCHLAVEKFSRPCSHGSRSPRLSDADSPILPSTKVGALLDRYPQLEDVLIDKSRPGT